MKTFGILGCLLLGSMLILGSPLASKGNGEIKLDLDSAKELGKRYSLNLSKRSSSILHPNIKVIRVDHHEDSGSPVFHHWMPSEEERMSAEDLFIDHENLAAVRVTEHEDGYRKMAGVVDGHYFEHDGEAARFFPAHFQKNATDYIDLDRGITSDLSPIISADVAVDAVVELAIVCDKEWGDLFNHDRQKMLEYWSVFYWDMNMRFQSLPSLNISLRLTSITVFSSLEAQSFIEESRNPEGKVSFYTVLPKFGAWIGSQAAANAIPKYDAAMLALKTINAEGLGGLAYVGTACNPTLAAGVTPAEDIIRNQLYAAHELAHILNAHHRGNIEWCEDKRPGFILSPEKQEQDDIYFPYYFDSCNDIIMSDFVRSDRASCLRRIDEPGTLPVDPSLESFEPPSILEQCKQQAHNDSVTSDATI